MDSDVAISQDKIEGDAIAVIIAGSDTSGCVLLFLFYYLVKIPSLQDDLRNELSATNGDWHAERLEKLPVLNALIKETMRLFPPLATSGLRTVGPSGLQLGDVYVLPGIIIAMPMYSFGRLESCYERASEFLP
ncbi:cytochrome P450 [Karstenula rhodostoma CBS 690.94]|uniref:Cytochrome P450 n=1 Tax=Karstenula rhodostoma CBS 690.94 TaxID=1392251 RepID=A0A9P4PWM6_9PLEO|nr:cytochrome P450 [Karstenula rhodostoma CBS 690.94]